MTKWITSKEAAEILDCDPDWVRKLCQRKRITCNKPGRDWLIDRDSLLTYKNSYRKRGPKPKQSITLAPATEAALARKPDPAQAGEGEELAY